jgi:hypothetical protein
LQTSALSAEVCRDGRGSVRDSSILEASRAVEQKGEGRGDPGLFIAGFCLAEGARVARGGGIRWPEGVGLERVSCPGKKRKLTCGLGSSTRGRSEGAYQFSSGADWAVGRIRSWASLIPPTSFFFSLFSFSFSIF